MNNRPTLNRELVIPILIGGLSVVGIVVVLMIGRALNAPAEVAMTPSSTPFQYIYLGTEPAITTLVVEGSELPLSEEPITEEPITDIPVFPTATRPAVSTPIILTQSNPTRTVTSTPSRTPAAASSTAAAGNTYDDTDLDYSGSWTGQTGVTGAYNGTLHISYIVGNSVTFTFTGTIIHVYYQADTSFGTMTVVIDNDNLNPPLINQAQNTTQIKEWVSDTLSSGTHTVVITHNSGGSINIDKLYIPVPTPTPTKTPTP